MKSFPNDGFYDLSELRGWVTSRARLPTLGSRLVILIEFYIAPKDSQDLRQEVGGVAQERLLRSGKCSKTQVGHSGQGPVTAHLSLRATVTQGNSPSPSSPPATWSALTQRGTDSALGSFSTQQPSKRQVLQTDLNWHLRGNSFSNPDRRDCSSFYLLLPEETTMEINVKIHPRSRKIREAPKCLSSRE